MVRSIYAFMMFAFLLSSMGFASELIRQLRTTPENSAATVALLEARPAQTNAGNADASREEINNLVTNTVGQKLNTTCFVTRPDRRLHGIVDALIYRGSQGYANNVSFSDTNFTQAQQNCIRDILRGTKFPEPVAVHQNPADNEYWLSIQMIIEPQ
jgi:hypothetical protein